MVGTLITQMAQLFIIIAIGYVLFKAKYLNVQVNQKLTKILLDVTLPLLIISSVMNMDVKVDPSKVGTVFLVSFALYVVMTAISVVWIKVLHFPKKQQGIYMFMSLFGNTAFMGFPIINALFGSEAMLYTAILNIFFNLFLYTVGIMMINYDASANTGLKSILKLVDTKNLISTGTIGSLLAIVIYFLPVHFPDMVYSVCSKVGGLTSPLAMLLIGASLARIPVRRVFNDWHIYLFTVVRQILLPLAAWPLMKLVIADNLIRNVIFILFLMPVGNTAVLFCTRYEKDEELASKTVFVTTLLAILTVPLVLMILRVE